MQEILISENAISKVSSLLVKEENSELKLRVFVTGGGCNGFSYGFTFDEEMNEIEGGCKKRLKLQKSGLFLNFRDFRARN